MGPAIPSGSERLTSLDGLRGLAAFIVVVHHCVLALPSLTHQMNGPDRTSAAWWLTYTPAHLVWAGGEAVIVFFVLSGLVLSLPHLRPSRPGTWAPYYVKRALRLYLPVIGAVALAGVLVALFPRSPDPAQSWWMNAHAVPADVTALAHDAWLLGGTGWLNSALWSLEYEVFFSLFLPVFVVLVRPLNAPLWASMGMVLLGCGWAAASGRELLSYLFVFAAGVLLAQRLTTLRAWAERIDRGAHARFVWAAIGVAAVQVLLGDWWMRQFVDDWTLWLPIGRPAGVLGAAVLVFCFLHCPLLRSFGNSRPLQWLGTVSFSLYLVHEPIVVSVATLMPPTARGVLMVLVVGLPVSFAVAVLFQRLVERPSQRLAGLAGRAARRQVVREPGMADGTARLPALDRGARVVKPPAPVAVPSAGARAVAAVRVPRVTPPSRSGQSSRTWRTAAPPTRVPSLAQCTGA